ncbi:hypothetical protein CR203_22905 [Salipaludibacillus neizhouensis]|uniref:Aspartate racemase n=1 Tax=Salipaludibacillus neizhouensis TaxID=885475 RepID=A0A3A9KCE8_9BACI|nr:hypothetical protein CR203_22905 [Salipaludibacillus neizhouensis]
MNTETKKVFLNIINEMVLRGDITRCHIGCTELPLLIKDEDLNIHQLNTTEIHVNIVDTIFTD